MFKDTLEDENMDIEMYLTFLLKIDLKFGK
jgi:hypothetical protein